MSGNGYSVSSAHRLSYANARPAPTLHMPGPLPTPPPSAHPPTSASDLAALSCPVCLTTMSEPKVFTCGHSMCADCAERIVTRPSTLVTIYECPVCRHATRVSSRELPTNYLARGMEFSAPISDFSYSHCTSYRAHRHAGTARREWRLSNGATPRVQKLQ